MLKTEHYFIQMDSREAAMVNRSPQSLVTTISVQVRLHQLKNDSIQMPKVIYIDVSMISYLKIFTLAPELRGVRYKLSAAINNGTVWVDRNYKFSNMPAYLEGTLLFQVPHKAIRQGTIIEFLSHQASTIYLAHEGVRNGGFKSSLPKYGWKLVTNHAQLRTGCCNLRYIWKKVVTNDDLTTISLPATTTSETVHCIFVQSMYTRTQIAKLIFTNFIGRKNYIHVST